MVAYLQISYYNAVFCPMNLVFLEEDNPHPCHLDFKLLDENNNIIISKMFFLRLLNKGNEYLY